jgi:N-acetylmuramoyl-L-alanine amidase
MITAAAITCLALNLYHEGRDQTVDQQAWIGYVTVNRVADPRWPDTVCEVVHQSDQFSWYWDGESDFPLEAEAYAIAVALSRDILSRDYRGTDATHYHNLTVAPSWSTRFTQIGRYGTHVFYR